MSKQNDWQYKAIEAACEALRIDEATAEEIDFTVAQVCELLRSASIPAKLFGDVIRIEEAGIQMVKTGWVTIGHEYSLKGQWWPVVFD